MDGWMDDDSDSDDDDDDRKRRMTIARDEIPMTGSRGVSEGM